ncbi:hypothetical protein KP509_31G020500 [Ceratopteris richardii]|uniref:Tocopherol cyclase n=1 Tax=Ceratopteris richardii TaxID=49495 RepID=A0A8T2QXU9_CERRI|nr:hypothetical protein KP509_31G020500 [Ceratopteris richardii]
MATASSFQRAYPYSLALASAQQFPNFSNPQRELRTPHSGYHYDGSKRRFFEGWYFKVSIPEVKQSFAFMYSVEDPAFSGTINPFEERLYGPRYPGVGAQVMGADDGYICQFSKETNSFWGRGWSIEKHHISCLYVIMNFKRLTHNELDMSWNLAIHSKLNVGRHHQWEWISQQGWNRDSKYLHSGTRDFFLMMAGELSPF